MHSSKWAVLTASVLVTIAAHGFLPRTADASALLGDVPTLAAVKPIVEPVAHKPEHWYWEGGAWWRHGPWAHHGIHGIVMPPPFAAPVFAPWGWDRLQWCAARYPSFDPATNTYVTSRGERRICHSGSPWPTEPSIILKR